MVFMNHETRNTAFFRVLRPSGGGVGGGRDEEREMQVSVYWR